MPGQSLLFDMEAAEVATDSLFFALFPDAATAAGIAELVGQVRDQNGLTGKSLKPDRFHVTLHPLGDYAGLPKGVVDSAKQAASSLALSSFDVCFDRVESFGSMPRNRPLVLRAQESAGAAEGADELARFQKALGHALKLAGLGRWVKPSYTPHVTMLYDDIAVPALAVPPVRWTAHEFVLVHSLLGRNQHHRLASWPLSAS